MNHNNENILGYIKLETGPKLITPMSDIFINYTFQKESNWEQLRMIANIFYHAYIEENRETNLKPIEGEITVSTQFPYFKNPSSSQHKAQDLRIESKAKVDFIEIQNEMYPKMSISKRSMEYLGFSLTRGKDKQQSSMWLLNGTVAELLNGKIFSNYLFMDEKDHYKHPNEVNVLYVDLKKLARMDTKAGELAAVLTAVKTTEPKNEEVRAILRGLKENFQVFKSDTEVHEIMTRAEQLESIGKARGKAETEAELLPLLEEKEKQISEKDNQISEKDNQISENKKQISEKDKRIAQLEAMLANVTTLEQAQEE